MPGLFRCENYYVWRHSLVLITILCTLISVSNGMVARIPGIPAATNLPSRQLVAISAVKKPQLTHARNLGTRLQSGPPQAAPEPPAVTVATWNVNSVQVRLPALIDYLQKHRPDVLALQEIKCTNDAFPRAEIEAQGYYSAFWGQKAYNGVAILSRSPIEDVQVGLPDENGDEPEQQARYLEATTCGGLRVCNLYLPNGEPVDSDKFEYRRRWTARLARRAQALLATERPVVLLGDFNVCPTDEDCFDADRLAGTAAVHPSSRAAIREICHMGYTNALKARPALGSARTRGKGGAGAGDGAAGRMFSYWGFQGGSWQRGEGLLIDHVLLSPAAADRLVVAGIVWQLRGGERPSDHVPVWARLLQ